MSEHFAHAPYFADDSRVLIKSICKHCGEYAVVSIMDGSCKDWETSHRCPPKEMAPQWTGPK